MVRSRASVVSIRWFLMSGGMRSVSVVVLSARFGGRPGRAFMWWILSVVVLTVCRYYANVWLTG